MMSDLCDPIVLALLIPAMKNKENIIIKGKVSKNLLQNLQGTVQDILIGVIDDLEKITITADKVVEEDSLQKTNVIAGFSAGVDAFITFEDYYLTQKYGEKITHFIFNNLTYSSKRVTGKIKNIKKIVDKYNLPFFQTWTNLHSFYPKDINFEQSHTLRNAAIPHFLSGIPNKFLYSSTFHKDLIKIRKSKDLGIVDDILLPLLSSNRVDCVAVGSEYTRLEKTLRIGDIEDAYLHLDTCIKKARAPFLNCGSCRKCKRALLTFETINKVENFSKIFDLEKWKSNREKYLIELKESEQPNDKELYNYIKSKL